MKFLLISDAHGSVENVEKLSEIAKSVDAVLFAGDFAKFGAAETAKPVLDSLCRIHDTIFAVRGNCDEIDFLEEMENADICVERSLVFKNRIAFLGAGGGTKFSLDTPFEREEDDIVSDLSISDSLDSEIPLVAVIHNPPKDTDCDRIPAGINVGSQKVREWIEKKQPILVVTGHIHESQGKSKIGKSLVVNPGALFEGKYALCEIKSGEEPTVEFRLL